MPAEKYSITIRNETGGTKRYALFNEPPDVQWTDQKVWSTVLTNAVVPNAQTAEFDISKEYSACIGNFDKNPQDDDGAAFTYTEVKPVKLGTKLPGGNISRGTSVEMIAGEEEGGYPRFEKDKSTNNGAVNGFEFITRGDFTLAGAIESKDGFLRRTNVAIDVEPCLTMIAEKLMIGFGAESNGYSSPLAVFVPEPSTYYSIRPNGKFRLIVSGYTQGALVDATKYTDRGVLLDFSNKENMTAEIRHDDHGKLVVVV